MINRDITVERPAGTKIQTVKGHRYVYHVKGKKYNPSSKSYTEDRVSVGVMVDEDKSSKDNRMYPNEKFYEYFPDADKRYEEAPVFSRTLKVGGSVVLRKVMKELELEKLIKEIYGVRYETIENLIEYMILFETSTYQHYPELMRNHPVHGMKIVSDSYISEFLNDENMEEDNGYFLEAWNKIHSKENTVYIGYDSTNINNQAKGIELVEYGHPKIDVGAPQVNLSYAIDEADSTPLFYELYPGSVVDNSQCKYMAEKANDYGYKDIGFILDRGYAGAANIRKFDEEGYAFVLMMKENWQCVKEAVKSVISQLVSFKQMYYIAKYEVCGITVKGKLFDRDKKTRYFHVYYDVNRAANQQQAIMYTYAEKEKKLQEKLEKKILSRKEDVKDYEKEFSFKYDENGYVKSYKRREKVIQKKMDECGFFVICTSEEMSAEEALDIYRSRDESEKLFRLIKTELDYDKLAVYSDRRVRNKTQLVFLATIVRNAVYRKLKPVAEKTRDKKNYTVNAALHTLENIEATKNTQGRYRRDYALTKKQKTILSAFGIQEKDIDRMVANL